MTVGREGTRKGKLPYPEIRTSHQVRELVLQLLDGILALVVYDNVDIMIARMPDYGARQ